MSEWINKRDRLPKIGRDVLVATNWFDCKIVITVGYLGGDGAWIVHDLRKYPIDPVVDYWMPLPEPPTIQKSRKGETAIIKRSIEDPKTIYVCFLEKRYIFREGRYVGFYRP